MRGERARTFDIRYLSLDNLDSSLFFKKSRTSHSNFLSPRETSMRACLFLFLSLRTISKTFSLLLLLLGSRRDDSTMCFSMEMSAIFAAIGLFASWWIWSRTSNKELASGVFFFFTMELLQSIQYLFIAPNLDSPICETIINQLLTVLGFLHICLQPYFCHVINASLTKNSKYLDCYRVIKRLCLIGKREKMNSHFTSSTRFL